MEPKRSYTTKILIGILIVLVLIAILLAGLYFSRKKASDRDRIGDAAIDTPVDTLKIEWDAGSVAVSVHEENTVSFRESGAQEEDDRMRYRLDHGELTIRCRKQRLTTFSSAQEKDLEVLVPAEMLRELEIDVASAKVELQDLTLSELSVDAASGDLLVSGCSVQSLSYDTASGNCDLDAASTIGEFSMDSASGDAYLEGAIRQLELDAASGGLTLITAAAPDQMELDMVSGSCDITLPADTGFTVELDDIGADLILDGFTATQKKGRYICGSGKANYEINMAGGHVTFHAGT